MPKNKKMKIEFAPGAFDQFDGTQEELDALIAEIQRLADSGALEEMSVPLDTDENWENLSQEDEIAIEQALAKGSTRH